MRLPIYILNTLLLALLIRPGFAQEYTITEHHYSVEDGLSGRFVQNVQQDSNGLIWICTYRGIEYFDGSSFHHVFEEESLVEIVISPINELWISQDVIATDPFGDHLIYNKLILPKGDNNIPIISKTNDADFIAINQTQQIELRQDGSGKIIGQYNFDFRWPREILAKGTFISLRDIVYQKDIFWLHFYFNETKQHGIYCFDRNGQEHPLPKKIEPYNPLVTNCYQATQFEFLVKANNQFKIYNIASDSIMPLPSELTAGISRFRLGIVPGFKHLSNAELDFYLLHNKIQAFDKKGKLIFDIKEKGGLNPTYSDIFLDRENNLWASSSNGLNYINFQKNKFTTYLQPDKTNYSCRKIIELDSINFLVHTYNGTQQVDVLNKTNKPFQLYKNLSWGYDMILTPDSAVISSTGRNLFRQKEPFKSNIPGEFLDSSRHVGGIQHLYYDDATSHIWVAGQIGIMYAPYNESQLGVFKLLENDNGEAYQCSGKFILRDHDNLLIATDQGLLIIDPETKSITELLDTEHSDLPTDEIIHVTKDVDSIYWLSTQKGLVKWYRGLDSMSIFNKNHGFINLWLKCAYDDGKGHLWIPTEKGLVLFNKDKESLYVILKEDGLAHDEFNTMSHFKDSQGRFHFGGLNGVTMFHPDSIINRLSRQPSYRSYLSSIKVFDTELETYQEKVDEYLNAGEIIIGPNEKSLQIKFNYLDYLRRDKVQYAYQFEGQDLDWTIQNGSIFYFGTLPYGKHLLNMKARGTGAIWSEVISVLLVVKKPLHLNPWSWFISFLIAGLFVFWWAGYRFRLAEKRNIELENKVKHRTEELAKQKATLEELNSTNNKIFAILAHDLKGPANSFSNLSENMKYLIEQGDKNRIQSIIKSFEEKGNRIGSTINRILDWAISEKDRFKNHPEDIDINAVLKEVLSEFDFAFQKKRITVVNSISKNASIFIDKNAFIIVIRNLITNAIKFSPRDAEIKIIFEQDNVAFWIENEGEGVPTSVQHRILDEIPVESQTGTMGEKGTGVGLVTVVKLLKKNHFKLKFDSSSNRSKIGFLPENRQTYKN